MTRTALLTTAALLGAFAAACDDVFDIGGEEQVVGVIAFHQDDIVIEVPDTVQQGQFFTVRVRTYGGGCISRGPTDVRVDDLRATVTPYDIDSGASACTSILRVFDHQGRVRFDRAGAATVVVRGRRMPEDDILTIERSVVVR